MDEARTKEIPRQSVLSKVDSSISNFEGESNEQDDEIELQIDENPIKPLNRVNNANNIKMEKQTSYDDHNTKNKLKIRKNGDLPVITPSANDPF